MRYLNKIILIESAGIPYAEVSLDGNVHLTGTQGVGKSTLLRAILFFYNADSKKLGIPIGKKNFTDFYFPLQNSYIIYEVVRETGTYCVLAYRSQGRISFRFIDSSYQRNYFIDSQRCIHENWDQVKRAIGKQAAYSRKVDRYEEYRNILYGNNRALDNAFRKYSLLDSKQYENIPRAIQHVFLNYKVESDFIKDTIIKSINENEIPISLDSYARLLKKFNIGLADIRKWSEKNRDGERPVIRQAEKVTGLSILHDHTRREREQLAKQLIWKHHETEKSAPVWQQKQEQKANNLKKTQTKKTACLTNFDEKKKKIEKELSILEDRLKEIKIKADKYEQEGITSILERASQKSSLTSEKESLTAHKTLLEADFTDINQKYDTRINLWNQQLATFTNEKNSEINKLEKQLLSYKEELTALYEKQLKEIDLLHKEEIAERRKQIEEHVGEIQQLKVKQAHLKNKRLYEKEIENCITEISHLEKGINLEETTIQRLKNERETIRKNWDLDFEKNKTSFILRRKEEEEKLQESSNTITRIEERLANWEGTFFDWLNQHYPDWENTIGKVIDPETVLFSPDLSPSLLETNTGFFGVEINTDTLERRVKSLSEYKEELVEWKKTKEKITSDLEKLQTEEQETEEKLRKKFQPLINAIKEEILVAEYNIEQYKNNILKKEVERKDYNRMAEKERTAALEKTHLEIENVTRKKIETEALLANKEETIEKQKEHKKRERDKKKREQEKIVSTSIATLTKEIEQYRQEADTAITQLKTDKKKALNNKGADTEKISQLENRIREISRELKFIEDNSEKISRYKYDKEELFDKKDIFKEEKSKQSKKLELAQQRYLSERRKIEEEEKKAEEAYKEVCDKLKEIEEDLKAYEDFTGSSCYDGLAGLFQDYTPIPEHRTAIRSQLLIRQLYDKDHLLMRKWNELKSAINLFTGNFPPENTFNFPVRFDTDEEYLRFAGELKEFMEEDMLSEYERKHNQSFADLIKQIGRETTGLTSQEGEIETIVKDINHDFIRRNFAGVIRKIELRLVASNNQIFHLLREIKQFNDETSHDLGEINLFTSDKKSQEEANKKATALLERLNKSILLSKSSEIRLHDTFELEFRVEENDNDTGWVQNLANVGSDGTDVLVKAMINIMLLNVFKEKATKRGFQDFRLHCMMDEIGKLHPNNVKGILKFANDRNIFLVNGSPQSFDATAYRYTYQLSKKNHLPGGRSLTTIKRIITNNRRSK